MLIPHLPALSAAIHGKAKGGSAEAAAGWEDTATQATGHTTLCVSSQVRCWGLCYFTGVFQYRRLICGCVSGCTCRHCFLTACACLISLLACSHARLLVKRWAARGAAPFAAPGPWASCAASPPKKSSHRCALFCVPCGLLPLVRSLSRGRSHSRSLARSFDRCISCALVFASSLGSCVCARPRVRSGTAAARPATLASRRSPTSSSWAWASRSTTPRRFGHSICTSYCSSSHFAQLARTPFELSLLLPWWLTFETSCCHLGKGLPADRFCVRRLPR